MVGLKIHWKLQGRAYRSKALDLQVPRQSLLVLSGNLVSFGIKFTLLALLACILFNTGLAKFYLFIRFVFMDNIITHYQTITQLGTSIFADRGSKFLGFATPINKVETVKPFILKLKKEHQKANHFCYAYRLGEIGRAHV